MVTLGCADKAGRTGHARVGTFLLVPVLVAAALCVGFGSGMAAMWQWGPQIRRILTRSVPFLHVSDADNSREQRIDLLWEAWGILEGEYLEPQALDEKKMVWGAVSGAVATVGDAHTVFVEPAPAAMIEQAMQGAFEGIGATVEMVDGRLVIVRPLPNSPALAAGLQAGDVVLSVDDQSIAGKAIMDAVELIRGPKGTTVRLLISRPGVAEPFVATVLRDRVEMPIVEARMLDDGIAYLRLREFNALSNDRFHSALEELMRQHPAGMLVDLRGNPGGYLQMSIDIASEFLPRSTLVVAEQERGKPRQEYRTKADGLAADIPLALLVDGGSASASEIVAGAIRDSGRGAIVGETTYGKGSVQNTHRLQDGSSLRVTIAKWYLPSGRNLDAEGLQPDIEVLISADDIAAGRDPQLERAVALLRSRE